MKRKIMAFTLAMAMTVSSMGMTAFAADPEIDGVTVTWDSNGEYAGQAIEGTGSTTYVDKDITIVTLPTAAPSFVLDPQGLYQANLLYNVDDTDDDGTLGAIIGTVANDLPGKIIGDNVLQVTNKGANAVKVTANIVATVEGFTDEPTKPIFGKVADATGDHEKDNILEFKIATHSDTFVNNVGTEATGTTANPVTIVTKSGATGDDPSTATNAGGYKGKDPEKDTSNNEIQVIIDPSNETDFDDGGQAVAIVLKGDDTYDFKNTGGTFSYEAGLKKGSHASAALGNTSPTTNAFYITGKLNEKANWSKYTGANKVGTKIIYKVSVATSDDVSNATNGFLGAVDAGTSLSGTGTLASATLQTTAGVFETTPKDLDTTYLTVNSTDLTANGNWSRGKLGSVTKAGKVTLTKDGITAAGITAAGTYNVEVKTTDGKLITGKLVLTA